MTATRLLSRDEIGGELDRIRDDVIAAKYREFGGKVRREDLEDAYGEITLDALARTFTSVAELGGFVHRALYRDGLDMIKSAAFRSVVAPGGEAWESAVAGDQSPERAAIVSEARARLREFLAELSDQDRQVAFLALDPRYDWPARTIATQLGLPYRDVTKTIDRTWKRVDRLAAMALVAGKMCSRRRRDVLRWQQTGECPRALVLHCYRCASCRAKLREAREASRSAILPLIPAGALSLAAPGAIARVYHAIATHPAVQRLNDASVRIRKAAPIGGGGGAAIASKLAIGSATVIAGAGAALHAAVEGHSPPPHHHRHRPGVVEHAHIARAAVITATTPAITVPASTTTTAVAAPAPAPTTTAAATTTSQPVTPPPPDQASAGPAPTPTPTTASAATTSTPAAPTQAPSAPTSSGGSTGGSSGRSSASASGTNNGPPAPGGPPPP